MSIEKTRGKKLAAGILACAMAPALAGNVTFLKDTSISNMTDEDMEIMRAAARNALDYTADGQPRRWENMQTGAAGVLTPLATLEQDGMHCRRLELFNEVKGTTGRSVFLFCQQPDGTWRISSKPAPRPSNGDR